MKAEGWSQVALAKVAGTQRQTVNNWLNDPGYEHMDADYAFNIAEQSKSKFNPRWIYSGDGPERLSPPPTKEEQTLLAAIRALPPSRRGGLAAFLET